MNIVSDNIKSGTSTMVSTVKNVSGDISNVTDIKFYKNPVLYLFSGYILFLVVSYMIMSKSVINNYVYSNKFRDENGNIKWLDILIYPHGINSVSDIIKTIFTGPIILYVFIFTIIYPSLIQIKPGVSTYFYLAMVNYFILTMIFMVHVFIINKIISIESIKISSDMDTDKVRTYGSIYRTQWVLLLFLSPIYAFIILYINKKTSNPPIN